MTTLRRNLVFYASLLLFLALTLLGVLKPDRLDEFTRRVHEHILAHFGWAYLISAFLFLILSLYIAFSRYGRIKLGGDHEKPYYSFYGWFSMLFAAGMGIGMVFWGVAEPMSHYLNPPENIASRSGDAAEFAMRFSFFHWGLHPWAIYIIMSLCIAYFSFRRGMPPLISSCFYPLVGDRIFGALGKVIDIMAVFATVFGIVTSLGLGAMQITGGLGAVFQFTPSLPVTLGVIAVVTVLFLISSISGLDKGIQILSKANILLALLLLVFMFLTGPSTVILEIFTNTLADYLTSLVDMSLSTNPFQGREWTRSWTLFYWAWWISWSPFVGMFVASISRGRTIREFIFAALLVPPLLTFVWFSVFAGAAFHLEQEGAGGIAAAVAENVSTGLFTLYAHYPLGPLLSLITVVLLGVFFVTSADSATFVLAMMTSHGNATPPIYKKIVWGGTISCTAAILLNSGGLEALQRMAIAAALPFTVIMLLLCRCLVQDLSYELRESAEQEDSPDKKA
jgi:glycine betaine transporter